MAEKTYRIQWMTGRVDKIGIRDAPPSWITQLDIGLVQPRNLVRP